jgi:hypothetical protein
MPKRSSPKRDFIEVGCAIVERAIGERMDGSPLPAMEAGISDHVWTIEELCCLLPEMASATKRIDKGLILKALGERAGQ